MTATIATPISEIELIPGSAIQINGLSWERYLNLLEQFGDHSLLPELDCSQIGILYDVMPR